MPFDAIDFSAPESRFEPESWRVYVCECGNIRVETRHFRQSFSPEEFVGFLREKLKKRQTRVLPVLPFSAKKMNGFCDRKFN